MRFLLITILLLPYHVLSQTASLSCRQEEGELVCEFRLPDGTQRVQLSSCPDDLVCVEAQIAIRARGTHNEEDSEQQESHSIDTKDRAIQETIVEDSMKRKLNHAPDAKEFVIVVHQPSHIYSPPWSQYGHAIAKSLQKRPRELRSWEYGDWLITFAIAVRGNPADEFWDPSSVEKAEEILLLSVDHFEALQLDNDATVSIGISYMTLGETMLFDSYNPRYDRAMEYFQTSNNLFQEALDRNVIPLGISRQDIELNWADTLVQIGVLTVESQMGQLGQIDLEFLTGGIGKLTFGTERATVMLDQAVSAFRKLVLEPNIDKTRLLLRRIRLANALQNYASISSMAQIDLGKSNDLLEEAVSTYTACLEELDDRNPEKNSVITGIAEALYSLADGNLQAGKYTKAKEYYSRAMHWYKDHPMYTPTMQSDGFLDTDETLAQTEQALRDYEMMINGGDELQIPNDRSRSGSKSQYQADHLYEADLQSNLGALRMARGEWHLAVNHLRIAIKLYARALQSGDRIVADAKLNLALAYFKQGEYDLSAETHADALDVYKSVIGEGKNPLDLEDILLQHGLGPSVVKGEADEDADTGRLIDLDAYQASIKNATAVKDEL